MNNKRKILSLSLLIGLLFLPIKTNALDYLKKSNYLCTETEEYKKWKALSDAEKSNTVEPIKCQEMVVSVGVSGNATSINNVNYKTTPSFDLRNVNGRSYVTPVKNQVMDNGTDSNLCWAFTTNSVIESSNLIAGGESLDLSERHIAFNALKKLHDNTSNPFGYNNRTMENGVGNGGTYYISGTYLIQRRGPVLESKVPFSTISSTKANTLDLSNDYSVGQIIYNSATNCQSNNAIDKIKQQLVTYGAVGSMMRGDLNYLSADKKSFYYNGTELYNHAVTIIGWDDNYSKDNFTSPSGAKPAGDGAWLVKNTYPNYFQISDEEKGYHYISYYDSNICKETLSVANITTDKVDNSYINDKLGFNGSITGNKDVIYTKDVYTKKSSNAELLDSIALYIYPGLKYEIYVSDTDDFSKATKVLGGTGTTYGYENLKINNRILFTKSKLYIYVKYTNSSKQFPASLRERQTTSSYYDSALTSGISYYSFNGTQWIDTTSDSDLQFYPSVYAFTDTIDYNLVSQRPTKSSKYISKKKGGYFYIPLELSNIPNLSSIGVKIYRNNVDKTNMFDIEPYQNGYKVSIKKDETEVGDYKISFTYKKLSTSQAISVPNEYVAVSQIKIDGLNEVSVNGTLQLKTIFTPDSATDKAIIWESSNTDIAIVDGNGVVTGRKEGTVTIKATSNDNENATDTITINVVDINKNEGNGTTKPNTDKGSTAVSAKNNTKNPRTAIDKPYFVAIYIIVLSAVGFMTIKNKKLL